MNQDHVFGEKEFDVLLDLLLPFDNAFPEAQVFIDRLMFHLSVEPDATCEVKDWDEFRNNAIRARMRRPFYPVYDRAGLLNLFIALATVIRRVRMSYPKFSLHADRVMYELGRCLEPRFRPNQTFEQFHRETAMIHATLTTKVRGVG